MSREIKFRAWDKKRKGFINGFNMYGFSRGQGCPYKMLKRFNDKWREEDFDLNQFTGFYDKNGKEVYEGDNCDTHTRFGKGVVVFESGMFKINGMSLCSFNEIKVIGNIYENQELLEKQTCS